MNQTRVLRKVRVDRILPAHFQARQMFPPEAINQLAASMKEVGQNSPLLVRPAKPANDGAPSDECFELVCGECRLRAAKRLGWTTLWAVVEEMTDEEAALRGMVDNEQRRSLNPIERALGYQRLINEYGLSQQQVAQRGGIAGSTLSRLLVLLDEPSEIQEMLQRGGLTEYHCRALDRVADRKKRVKIAREVAQREMSAKETEDRVEKLIGRRGRKPGGKKQESPADLAADYGGYRFWWEGKNVGMQMRTFQVHDSVEQYATNFRLALKGFVENEPCPEAISSVDPEVAALIATSGPSESTGGPAPSGLPASTTNPGSAVAAPLPEHPPPAITEQKAVKLFGEALKALGETVEEAMRSKKR